MIIAKTLPEDVDIGTQLGTFKATDADIGLQASVTYSISPNLGYLSIGNQNGILTVAKALDREMTPNIKVYIVATDNAPQEFRRSSNHSFTLYLIDLNDNQPRFNFTTPFYVKETAAVGSVAMVTEAKDEDEGDNAQMTYTLLHRNDSGIFEFDQISARFTLKGIRQII